MSKMEREIEQVAEGRDESTPFKALAGVGIVIAIFAGIVIAVGIVIWLLLR